MKKIFLWGNYDNFCIGHIKIPKEKCDFLLVTVRVQKNFRHQREIMIEEIKYIKNCHDSNGFNEMKDLFQKESPEYLAVLSGHDSINTMEEFNKTKSFCSENNAELMVIKPSKLANSVVVDPSQIYEQISRFLAKSPTI